MLGWQMADRAGQAGGAVKFGDELRRHRLATGLTQEELASRADMSVRAISDLERGRTTRPYRRSVRQLATALGLKDAAAEQFITRALPREQTADDTGLAGRLAELPGVGDAAASRSADGEEPAAAGVDRAIEPGAGVTVTPRQLPAAVRHFVGRAGTLTAMEELLDEALGEDGVTGGPVAIAAVSGTAGVGKSALAVHWAHRVSQRFPDGQLYVDLCGYDTGQPMVAADALAGFLFALGVPGPDIPAGGGERAAALRSLLAGRRVLIVVDNARDAEQVRPLLPGSPTCAVVVTSRDSLAGLVAREGASRVELGPLPVPEAISLLRMLIGPRARAEPAAVRRLAALCCRLPLALRVAAELAASRPHAGLADLTGELASLQSRLDLLATGGDQRTAVRAVLSWSCRYLDPPAARIFSLVGLHPGRDFDVGAAAALAGTTSEAADPHVAQLARVHLIEPGGPGRYRMHDLLRGYAQELAARGGPQQQRAALTRLFDYYLQAATVPDPALARAWFDREAGNLTAVVAHMSRHGWPGHATQMAAALGNLGDALLRQGRYPQAVRHLRRAASMFRKAGDLAGEATAVSNLAVADWRRGNYERAARGQERALALYRQIGDQAGQAEALNGLGEAMLATGHPWQAHTHHADALGLAREAGDQDQHARAWLGLARARLAAGEAGHASRELCAALGSTAPSAKPG